jgi:hypothetical protein
MVADEGARANRNRIPETSRRFRTSRVEEKTEKMRGFAPVGKLRGKRRARPVKGAGGGPLTGCAWSTG